jgi:hypothetical protein
MRDFDFDPGDLILVCNSWIKKELNQKTKPCYLGPMVVLHRTTGGCYLLAELDGTILKLRYTAFSLHPYFPRTKLSISITDLTGLNDLQLDDYEAEDDVEHEEESEKAVKDD